MTIDTRPDFLEPVDIGTQHQIFVAFFEGTGPISRAIRFQTRGTKSHSALYFPKPVVPSVISDSLFEAWHLPLLKGGRMRWGPMCALHHDVWVSILATEPISEKRYNVFLDWVWETRDYKYDYRGVLRFVSRRPASENGKFFCSEHTTTALRVAGLRPFREVPCDSVSPAMLSYSPIFTPWARVQLPPKGEYL